MLIPRGKRVLVQPIEVTQVGKILVSNSKPTQYKVIAMGDEVKKLLVDDIIYLEKMYGVEVEHEGVKYFVIDESSILAIVNN